MAARSRTAAVAVLLAAVLAGCGGSADGDPAEAGTQLTATRLDPPFEIAGTALQDARTGEDYSLVEDTDAPLTLVFFGYTHCPDICGQVMATMAGAMTRLSEADREQVDVVFVTTDPHRDDAAAVASYTEGFGDDVIGLTGSQEAVTEVAASAKLSLGYFAGKEEIPPAELAEHPTYDVEHGTQVFGVDDSGASALWNADVSQAQLAGDVHVLLAEAGDGE